MEENRASSGDGINIGGGNDDGVNVPVENAITETGGEAVDYVTKTSSSISAESVSVKQKKDDVPPDNASSLSSVSRTKFRIVSLHFPLDYSETVLMELMKESQSFHLWFEREMFRPDQVKRGGLSVSFDTEQEAKDAYLKIKDKSINGVRLKVQVPSWMDEFVTSTRTEEEPKTNSPTANVADNAQNFENLVTKRKLFVSQLLPTTDDDLIFAVFGRENLQHVDIMLDEKRQDGTRTAVLTFHTPELAEQSKHDYDGFVVDDGELSKPMKILLYSDYLNKKQSEKNRREAKKVESVPKVANPPLQLQQEISAAEKSHAEEIIPAPPSQNERRGKAGNLWSAQIVENRSVDGYIEKPVIISTNTQSKTSMMKDVSNVACSIVEEQQRIEEKISPKQRKASRSPARSEPSKVDVCEDSTHAKSCSEPFIDSQDCPKTEIDCSEHARFSGELSDAEISRAINSHIEQNRLNWAEVHSLEELWKIVDEIVKTIGWQPESALKQGMLLSLEKAEPASETEWWQRHIQFLIRMWKREVETEMRSKVRKRLHLAAARADSAPPSKSTAGTSHETTMVVSVAPHYVPLPPSPKVKRKSGKRALMELMGVGSFLANVHSEGGFSEPEGAKNERRSRKRTKSRNVSKRSKRASSCESGEASSTTTPSSDSDSDTSEHGRVTNSAGGYRKKKPADRKSDSLTNRSRLRRQRPPSLPRSIERVDGPPPLPQQHVMDSHVYPQNQQQQPQQMTAASFGPQVNNQPWIGANQLTPSSLVQMMPMMMQMFQMRMSMASAPAQQQFQQQFQQIYQQIRANMGSAAAQPTVDPVAGFQPNLPNVQQSSQVYGNNASSSSNQVYNRGGTGYPSY